MEILASHFNKKKSDFVSFFRSIIQLIEKLSYDIQIQIDKEFQEAAEESKGLQAREIEEGCMKMESTRAQIYEKMIDRLCLSLKSYTHRLNQRGVIVETESSQNKSILEKYNPDSKVTPFEIDNEESSDSNALNRAKIDIEEYFLPQSRKIVESEKVKTPPQNQEEYISSKRMPSPFAEKHKEKSLESTGKKVGEFKETKERSKSKQKIQVLKKNDICESLDNFFIKEAKQMLEKSQNRGSKQGMYSSRKQSNPNSFLESPFKGNEVFETNKNLENLIDNRFGRIKNTNTSTETRRINPNFVSPIEKIRIN